MRRAILLAGVCLAAAFAPPAFAAGECADLDLVLAIDASGSIDGRDHEIQKAGYVRAFQHPDVLAAIRSAGRVDVAAVIWGDSRSPVQVIGWHSISGRGGATAFAADLMALPRLTFGNTGIGNGVWAALDLLEGPGRCGARRVINVSGDGRESFGPRWRDALSVAAARSRAEAAGVTINALAITDEDEGLVRWYEDRVAIGPDAFVMEVSGFGSFAESIVRKLAREIAPAQLSALADGTHPERVAIPSALQ